MRALFSTLIAGSLLMGVAWGQATSGNSGPQIPYGQTFLDFQFPLYQNGEKAATIAAASAKGITLNRAETIDLKIQLYDHGAVTTTITSPKADLYVGDKKMRTKNTVLIVRSDLTASSQTCDFDLTLKRYIMRQNVKVVLKNFDASTGLKPDKSATPAPAQPSPLSFTPTPAPSSHGTDSMLDTPGAYASTNVGPIAPTSPNQ